MLTLMTLTSKVMIRNLVLVGCVYQPGTFKIPGTDPEEEAERMWETEDESVTSRCHVVTTVAVHLVVVPPCTASTQALASSQLKFQHSQERCSYGWGATGRWQQLSKEGEFLKMWSLVGLPWLTRCTHTYAHLGSMTGILRIINNTIKENINLGGGYVRGYEGLGREEWGWIWSCFMF